MPDRLFLQTIVNYFQKKIFFFNKIAFFFFEKCSPFHVKTNCYLLDSFDTQAFAFEIQNINEFDRIAQ